MAMNVPQSCLMADISDYQASFLARRYKRAGRRVVMIKAGEGTGAAGAEHHAARAVKAHEVGLIVIHYLMAIFTEIPEDCVDAFVDRIRHVWRQGDRMMIDVEDYSGQPLNAPDWMNIAQEHLDHKSHAPFRAIGYTNEAYMAEAPKLAEQADQWIIAAYDGLLLADGGTPKLPRKARLLGKQYTDGEVGSEPRVAPGIGPCDNTILTGEGYEYLFGKTATPKLGRRLRG
jgi:hypothetical protein